MRAYIFLIEHDIFPEYLKISDDLKGEKFKIAVLAEKKSQLSTVPENSPRKETGLLSTLTQLLSLSSTEEEDAQREKASYVSIARECVDRCQLEKISFISRYYPVHNSLDL
jgi:hypothetical protein